MTPLSPPKPTDDGFSLLELMIVTAIIGVVLMIASGALISLSQTASRGSTLITDEQRTSTALTQLATDIRSAHTISFPTGAVPTTQLVLNDNNPGGGTSQVEWIYQSSTSTLSREVYTSGTFVLAGTPLTGVVNSSTQPVFTYLNEANVTISGATNTTIANCTTRIKVNLYVAPPGGTTGVSTLQESTDVALTDQLAVLSAPGNGQC
jgi:prepilin-type N-terminal cleavage/methylation domain-containing protein